MLGFGKKEEVEPIIVESTLLPMTEEEQVEYRKRAAKEWADLVAPLTEEEGEQARKRIWGIF